MRMSKKTLVITGGLLFVTLLWGSVALVSAQGGADAEPNNGFSEPNIIAASGSVSGAIDPAGDHDWYRLTVESEGELSLLFTGVAEEAEIVARGWNANKDVLLDWQSPPRPGGDTDFIFDLPRAGTYYLEVAESSDNGTSPYSLQATFTAAPDPGERNDSFADAAPLTPGDPFQGYMMPVRDHDWYSFDVEGRAQVHALISNVAEELDMVLRVWNSNKDVLLDWQSPPRPGGDTDVIFDVPRAGRYYLEVADGSDNGRSTQAYTLLVELTLATDATEDNDIFMKAQPISLGGAVTGSILPTRDHDWYRLDSLAPGTLGVSIVNNPADLDVVARVWNADKDVACDWQSPPREGGDTVFECPLKEAGNYYIEVADGGDNRSSPAPYTLTAGAGAP